MKINVISERVTGRLTDLAFLNVKITDDTPYVVS